MLEWNAEEQAREDAAREAHEALLEAQDVRKVALARAAYLWAISPSVAIHSPRNISGAGRVLGMPYATVRPYVLAGEALAEAGRVLRTSPPEPVDVEIVEAAIEKFANGPRREHRRQT